MHYSLAILALATIVKANPVALPQAVTEKLFPTGVAPPSCTPALDFSFRIAISDLGSTTKQAKRAEASTTSCGPLTVAHVSQIGDGQVQGAIKYVTLLSVNQTGNCQLAPATQYVDGQLQAPILNILPYTTPTSLPQPPPATTTIPVVVSTSQTPQSSSPTVISVPTTTSRPPPPTSTSSIPPPVVPSSIPPPVVPSSIPPPVLPSSSTSSVSTSSTTSIIPPPVVPSPSTSSRSTFSTTSIIPPPVVPSPSTSSVSSSSTSSIPLPSSSSAVPSTPELGSDGTTWHPLVICEEPGSLAITLEDGVLKDQQGRTGYIAANYQFQFDGPPQAGAIITAGFSICNNGSLALGSSNVFYKCLSGTFYNLYDRSWALQCSPVTLNTLKLKKCI